RFIAELSRKVFVRDNVLVPRPSGRVAVWRDKSRTDAISTAILHPMPYIAARHSALRLIGSAKERAAPGRGPGRHPAHLEGCLRRRDTARKPGVCDLQGP